MILDMDGHTSRSSTFCHGQSDTPTAFDSGPLPLGTWRNSIQELLTQPCQRRIFVGVILLLSERLLKTFINLLFAKSSSQLLVPTYLYLYHFFQTMALDHYLKPSNLHQSSKRDHELTRTSGYVWMIFSPAPAPVAPAAASSAIAPQHSNYYHDKIKITSEKHTETSVLAAVAPLFTRCLGNGLRRELPI